jgi:hypothetical protein
MPAIRLDVSDAIELAELLARFAGSPAYGAGTLRDDLTGFIFLLGSSDG